MVAAWLLQEKKTCAPLLIFTKIKNKNITYSIKSWDHHLALFLYYILYIYIIFLSWIVKNSKQTLYIQGEEETFVFFAIFYLKINQQ